MEKNIVENMLQFILKMFNYTEFSSYQLTIFCFSQFLLLLFFKVVC